MCQPTALECKATATYQHPVSFGGFPLRYIILHDIRVFSRYTHANNVRARAFAKMCTRAPKAVGAVGPTQSCTSLQWLALRSPRKFTVCSLQIFYESCGRSAQHGHCFKGTNKKKTQVELTIQHSVAVLLSHNLSTGKKKTFVCASPLHSRDNPNSRCYWCTSEDSKLPPPPVHCKLSCFY